MPSTRLLHTDRQSILFLERSRVRVQGERVVYDVADETLLRSFNIPHANLSCLILGQGTSITQAAMRALSEEGVVLAVTGSGGTPLLMASFDEYRPTDRMRRWLDVYQDPDKSLAAAKLIQHARLDAIDRFAETNASRFRIDWVEDTLDEYRAKVDRSTGIDKLSGHEGQFCRKFYADTCRGYGIQGFKRTAGARRHGGGVENGNAVADMNRRLDDGNYLAYGLASVALWAYGIPAGLSVMHGKTRAGGLVFDLADSFKDAFVVPIAGECASSAKAVSDTQFRGKVIDAIDKQRLLKRVFGTVDEILDKLASEV